MSYKWSRWQWGSHCLLAQPESCMGTVWRLCGNRHTSIVWGVEQAAYRSVGSRVSLWLPAPERGGRVTGACSALCREPAVEAEGKEVCCLGLQDPQEETSTSSQLHSPAEAQYLGAQGSSIQEAQSYSIQSRNVGGYKRETYLIFTAKSTHWCIFIKRGVFFVDRCLWKNNDENEHLLQHWIRYSVLVYLLMHHEGKKQ